MSKTKTESSRAKDSAPDNLADAVAALARGAVIVFPTETLYGLGADALNPSAVERVFQLKGRDPNNPIPVLVADRAMLNTLVSEIPPAAEILIERFWPGPLTLVLPARPGTPAPLLNAAGGIGVRISSAATARDLVRLLSRPLTATSANPSGREPARDLAQAKNYFAGTVDVFLDGGTLTSKRGSTVVTVSGDSIEIIREGEVGASELQAALGDRG